MHVWDARVSAFAAQASALRATLDGSELQRADRFRFERDRLQYVVAHGLVRALLGGYLERPASVLRFATGLYGKPALVEPAIHPPLEYNLSHSGDVVLIAVARQRAVGIDVERWAKHIVYDELAEYCFSAAERSELRAASHHDKAAAFFAGWTRKEAYIKATGLGITAGLDYFDVSLGPGNAAKLLRDRRPNSSAGWRMVDLPLGAGYSGAVVACGYDWRLRRIPLAHDALALGAAP
ncbi:MAG: 4'-phosphopantetheinyl transferase superfamily protein [Candidatus Eremiobacteraeota bacterium]|nr:4'-phosphopantetheinyl transferase superfamily protein [Candidatus Eremiobacteraeota bacterium]